MDHKDVLHENNTYIKMTNTAWCDDAIRNQKSSLHLVGVCSHD